MPVNAATARAIKVAQIVGAALAGAALATWVGLPAPALIGSAATLAALTLSGWKAHVPDWLRDAAFSVIGITLGASVTPHFFGDISRFPATIVALTLTMVLVMLVTGRMLMVLGGLDRRAALLGTSPGALSVTLALAAERPDSLPPVMTLQTLRLVMITLLLPPLVALSVAPVAHAAAETAILGYPIFLVLFAVTLALGAGLARLRVPASFLIAGLLVSGASHFLDLAEGRPASPVTFAGLAMAGAVIGSRFSGVRRDELLRLLLVGSLATATAMAISAACAALTAWVTGFPFAAVWIAFAPGGVEGMAAMAIALGHDPVFVATHHIFRIIALILVLPILARRT